MRVVGMDIHRSFAQVAILEDGRIIKELRVELVHERVVRFAKTLGPDDEVVIETTGNSAAVERLMRPYVKRVIVANPRLVRAIAYARVKTDKIDAAVLAKLHASGFLPEVWVADEDTLCRRRQTTERMGVLEQAVRTKSRIHAILHANLIPKYKGHLFGKAGREWLNGLPLPDEEWAILGRLVDELGRISGQLAELDKVIAQQALDDPVVEEAGEGGQRFSMYSIALATSLWRDSLARSARVHASNSATRGRVLLAQRKALIFGDAVQRALDIEHRVDAAHGLERQRRLGDIGQHEELAPRVAPACASVIGSACAADRTVR